MGSARRFVLVCLVLICSTVPCSLAQLASVDYPFGDIIVNRIDVIQVMYSTNYAAVNLSLMCHGRESGTSTSYYSGNPGKNKALHDGL